MNKLKNIFKQFISNEPVEDKNYIKFNAYDDPVKFYALYRHYNISATNIGVLGDYDKFKEITKSYLKNVPNSALVITSNNTIRVIDKDIETSYVFIQTSKDLIGKKFRKYL